MSLGNPMSVPGNHPGNYVQPHTANPPHDPQIGATPFEPDRAAGPNRAPNYQQPDTANPTQPANQPAIASHPTGWDVLGLRPKDELHKE
jgi:hypothetical protein